MDSSTTAVVRLPENGSYADANTYHSLGAARILGNAFDDRRSRYSGHAITGNVCSTPTHGHHDVVSSNLFDSAGASTYGRIQDGHLSVNAWSSPNDVRATGVCNAFGCAATDVNSHNVNITGCTCDAVSCTGSNLASAHTAAHALDAGGRSR